MGEFYVKGTVRKADCDGTTAITALVLVQPYKGYTIHFLGDLKPLADANCLWASIETLGVCRSVRVEIYYSDGLRRWIARTEADSLLCNNLEKLPIYRPDLRLDTYTSYTMCALRK